MWSYFQDLVYVLNTWTSPFLFVFLPPMSTISFYDIGRALQAHKGFYSVMVSNVLRRYLHSDSDDRPDVLLNVIHLNSIINFLFCTSKKSSKSVNVLISQSTCTQIMSFILHWIHLLPFIFLNNILFYRIKPLFPWKTS